MLNDALEMQRIGLRYAKVTGNSLCSNDQPLLLEISSTPIVMLWKRKRANLLQSCYNEIYLQKIQQKGICNPRKNRDVNHFTNFLENEEREI